MNLLTDPWIPVRARSGAVRVIAPHEITDDADDPFVDFAAPRADFDGGLILFMIGLLDTAMAPKHAKAWRRLDESPPSTEKLREAFAPLVPHFAFDAGRERYMQSHLARDEGKVGPCDQLLLGAASGNGRKLNTDLFRKRSDGALCEPCAAMAVHTLQLSGHSRGGGFVAGLRGAGRLATVQWRARLWGSLWANVPERPAKPSKGRRFPWVDEGALGTLTQEGRGALRTVHAVEVDPVFTHWGAHLWLWAEHADRDAECISCGLPAQRVVEGVRVLGMGTKHAPPWEHALSPTAQVKAGKPDAYWDTVKTPGSRVGFDAWLGLVLKASENSRPAPALRRRVAGARLRVFGHAFDQASVIGYLDQRLPLLDEEEAQRAEAFARDLVGATRQAGKYLYGGLKDALYRGPAKSFGGSHAAAAASEELWRDLEAPFYALLFDTLEQGDRATPRERWLRELRRAVLRLFDRYANAEHLDHPEAARVYGARSKLERALRGKKLRTAIGLGAQPAADSPGKTKPTRARRAEASSTTEER